MSEEIFVVSDLHVGAGIEDPLDDFYEEDLFVDFIRSHAHDKSRFVINGDFIDFAQIEPFDVSEIPSNLLWDEETSLHKLNIALEGHRRCFEALGDGLAQGAQLTIIAGNHDFDLAWPRIQQRLREAIGGGEGVIEFVVGSTKTFGVSIEHGYQFTPENCPKDPTRFVHSWNADGTQRMMLERVWGTDFLLQFFNELERQHPYVDNVKPTIWLAWHGMRRGWIPKSALVKLLVFLKRNVPVRAIASTMDVSELSPDLLAEAFDESHWHELAIETLDGSEEVVAKAIEDLPEQDRMDLARSATVTVGKDLEFDADDDDEPAVEGAIMRLVRSGSREEACALTRLERPDVTHVVFGHTHQIVDGNLAGAKLPALFNPGSWIPHLDLNDAVVRQKVRANGMTLELVDDPSLYKTEPCCVRIRPGLTRSQVELVHL